MTNEQKAKAIADFLSIDVKTLHKKSCYLGAREMAKWKDEQIKQTLVDFMKYLDKRGFIQDDLCFDIDHQVETYIELRNRK